MERLIAGSRGSKLALWQAGWVKSRLEAAGYVVEIKVIQTHGDRLPHTSLIQPGSKGLFVKDIEEALAEGRIDLAVHSLKDLPLELPFNLHLAAVPVRDDPRDVLVSRNNVHFAGLPAGARVSTSSLRRQSQLRYLRADVCIVPIRGNVDTRVAKMRRGECDALVVAAAGLHRLGLAPLITQYFPLAELCPAVGQGALAVEIRRGDDRVKSAVEPLDDVVTHRAVDAERIVLRLLGGGCQTPVAVHAQVADNLLSIRGAVASVDGGRLIRAEAHGPAADVDGITRQLAANLIEQDAKAILQSL